MLPSFIYFFIITLSSTAAVLFSFSASVRTPHYTGKNKGSAQSLWNPFLFNIQSLCASDDFIEHQENINQDSCEPTHSAPCLLNSLSDKGAVHDQNISKKKKNISIDSIDPPKTPFIFKDMKLSTINTIPCMFKINFKSNTSLKLFTVVQLFNRCSSLF